MAKSTKSVKSASKSSKSSKSSKPAQGKPARDPHASFKFGKPCGGLYATSGIGKGEVYDGAVYVKAQGVNDDGWPRAMLAVPSIGVKLDGLVFECRACVYNAKTKTWYGAAPSASRVIVDRTLLKMMHDALKVPANVRKMRDAQNANGRDVLAARLAKRDAKRAAAAKAAAKDAKGTRTPKDAPKRKDAKRKPARK